MLVVSTLSRYMFYKVTLHFIVCTPARAHVHLWKSGLKIRNCLASQHVRKPETKFPCSKCPQAGPLRRRLNICAEIAEWAYAEKIDQKFKRKSPNRSRTSKSTNHGSILRVNGSISSNCSTILNAWENHFKEISSCTIALYYSWKSNSEMYIFFTAQGKMEVLSCTLLIYYRRNWSCPAQLETREQVQPEHLKYGGAALSIWIKQIISASYYIHTSVPRTLNSDPSVYTRLI